MIPMTAVITRMTAVVTVMARLSLATKGSEHGWRNTLVAQLEDKAANGPRHITHGNKRTHCHQCEQRWQSITQ